MGRLAVDKKVVVDGNSEDLTELCDRILPGSSSVEVQPEPAFAMNWRQRAQRLQKEAHVFYFVLKHPRTRWYSKLVAACTAAYLFSPIQLIPSFIPVIGLLDDFVVLSLGIKLLQRITPSDVFIECRELADAAEISRKGEVRSGGAVAASAVIATVWILAAITATALMVRYIQH
jgi:uncharacterized membrane protein YkvA (DUF1232 family)